MKIFRFFLNKHYQLDKHVLNIHISFQHLGLCIVIYRAVTLKLWSLSNRSSNNCTQTRNESSLAPAWTYWIWNSGRRSSKPCFNKKLQKQGEVCEPLLNKDNKMPLISGEWLLYLPALISQSQHQIRGINYTQYSTNIYRQLLPN